MEHIRLGNTTITTPQNAFGVLPIQRVSFDQARSLLRQGYKDEKKVLLALWDGGEKLTVFPMDPGEKP